MRIGADPELFLVDNDGRFRSAIGIVEGTKELPFALSMPGCAVQVDNVAAEFNIPPSATAKQFIEAINFNLSYLLEKARENGLKLGINASANFPPEELQHPLALEFGCDPDYNAWTKKVNPRPKCSDKSLRSAGGHIHIETKLDPFHVARCFDLCVVVPSLELDSDTRRRELYGKAGACRVKDYGVECRALSNFWLATDDLKQWVWDRTQSTIEFAQKMYKFSPNEASKIQTCINTSNLGLMNELKSEYGIQ